MWKDIKGYEEIYKISDTGETWSKDRSEKRWVFTIRDF